MRIYCIICIIFIYYQQVSSQEAFDYQNLCEKYSSWFASDTIPWTYDDSLASEAYSKKLFDLYKPIREIYYNGHYPYPKIYDIAQIDTALLFNLLTTYASSSEKYEEQFGIPFSLAHYLVTQDAIIMGTVVDFINKYPECRFFISTYFIRVDSVIHSYFPLGKGDTVLMQSAINGYTGYCDTNQFTSYGVNACGPNIKMHESGVYALDRGGYVNHFQRLKRDMPKPYTDPFCTNSFSYRTKSEKIEEMLKSADKEKLKAFIEKINTNKFD
ncbi:MAG: hypothetical protein R2764_14700 [Bacteroidales bacterium]